MALPSSDERIVATSPKAIDLETVRGTAETWSDDAAVARIFDHVKKAGAELEGMQSEYRARSALAGAVAQLLGVHNSPRNADAILELLVKLRASDERTSRVQRRFTRP